MKISGFTMVKNAGKLMYPFRESILSILPIVDELVIALGNCDDDDDTIEIIQSIKSDKIRVIHTTWDVKEYPNGTILAQQTDVAKLHCTGDWLIYLQADEVIHEKDYQVILDTCKQHFDNRNIEGLLFKYIHFWGDYDHAFTGNHAWYRNEIRVIRNKPEIHSWRDAQSFRVIEPFTKEKYLEKEGTRKLNVAIINAHIYHYGYVRPPRIMGKKQTHFESCYTAENATAEALSVVSEVDFGPLGMIPIFKGSHPNVMHNLIKDFNWADQLNYSMNKKKGARAQKHNRLKYRVLSAVENLFAPKGLFTFKNYNIVK